MTPSIKYILPTTTQYTYMQAHM